MKNRLSSSVTLALAVIGCSLLLVPHLVSYGASGEVLNAYHGAAHIAIFHHGDNTEHTDVESMVVSKTVSVTGVHRDATVAVRSITVDLPNTSYMPLDERMRAVAFV